MSEFEEQKEAGRMEDGSLADPFTQYYGQLLHQGNMLQDHVRTSCYQRAFLENSIDFTDKVVLDVGTGTGILAFFAIQAGAKKVYGIEASAAANIAQKLVEANNLSDKVMFCLTVAILSFYLFYVLIM
jgi:histone-arginine methyltransferase CARM1